ncbi:hypothetical protein F2181_18080 [Salmonella enterica]|nr:hypothetical protein [Salmonella enterica]
MDNIMLSRRPTSVNRGEVNLLGLGLSIAIGAVLIYGVISYATGVFSANDVQAEYSNGTTIITNARARLKTDGIYDFSGAADMTGTFIQLVPRKA